MCSIFTSMMGENVGDFSIQLLNNSLKLRSSIKDATDVGGDVIL